MSGGAVAELVEFPGVGAVGDGVVAEKDAAPVVAEPGPAGVRADVTRSGPSGGDGFALGHEQRPARAAGAVGQAEQPGEQVGSSGAPVHLFSWSSGPSAPDGGCPLPQPRNWSGPGTPGRPSDTSAARSANGPVTPATRSGHASDHLALKRTPGLFRKLDAVAVLTGPLLPVLAVIVIADSVRPVDVTVLPPELSGVYR